jgi:hypothetical protein
MRVAWSLIIVLGCFLLKGSLLIAADTVTPQCKSLDAGLADICEISIKGPFFNSQSLNPGDSLYFYQETITKNIPTSLVPGGFKHKTNIQEFYSFVGRTGEKTFELRRTGYSTLITKTAKPLIEEKNSYYFDTNVPLELQIMALFSKCEPKEMKIQVKLIDLQGSKLECQVVLPDCLKDR